VARPRAGPYLAVFGVLTVAIALVGRATYTTQQQQFQMERRAQIDQTAELCQP